MNKLLLSFLTQCCAICMFAYDAYIDGIYYNLNPTTHTAEVTNRSGINNAITYSGVVVIPSTVTYDSQTYLVTSVGNNAFYFCRSLVSVTIPNSVTTIGKQAFYDCNGLTSVTIGNSVTTIRNNAFAYCSSLTLITIPASVTTIESKSFLGCSCLTSITIPHSVKVIEDSTFAYCKCLASVVIPDSVTAIGEYAFSNCNALTTVVIGKSVTTIGHSAFKSCSGLVSIVSKSVNPPICGICFGNVSTAIPIYVPASGIDAYKKAYGWKEFTNIVSSASN